MILIDPPEGWRYGFPKPIDIANVRDLRKWLIDNGYPEKDVLFGMKHCRYIGTKEELENMNEEDDFSAKCPSHYSVF